MILTAKQIQELGLVVGGVSQKVDDGETPSYGLDGCGYTFRIDSQFSIEYIGPLNSMLLRSYEKVRLPNNVVARTYIKSTLGRAGIMLSNDCIIDPGYEGHLHVRLFNVGNVTYELDTSGGVFMVVFEEMLPTTPYTGRHQGNNISIGNVAKGSITQIIGVNNGVIDYRHPRENPCFPNRHLEKNNED